MVSGPTGLIVDGEGEAGQVNRDQFLAALREAVTRAADEALGPLESAVGCPYIERWFARHANTPAATLEALAKRYSHLINASEATDHIPPIVFRLRSGIARWRDGGDVSADLRAAGFADEIANVESVEKQSPETVAQKIDALGPAEQLPGAVASRMGAAMDDDFASVEIHTGPAAAMATADEGAVAMTIGQNIAFSPGAFEPGTPRGDALLAHELAHVQQQRPAAKADDAPARELGGESATHEEAADSVAGSALSRLWGRLAGGVKSAAKKTSDVVFSPLQLQRCSRGTEPKYEFTPHRDGPHIGQRVGVLAEGGNMVTQEFVHHARKTLGEAASESEAIAIAKVADKHAAIIAADGVFFVYEISTPGLFNPIYIANAGLKVDGGVVAIVANSNVYRPGFHRSTSTDATRGAYEEAFEPYLEMHEGGLGSVTEPEFLAVFEAAMRDNALKVLAESERQAKAKRDQFRGGSSAVSAGEKQTIDDVAREARDVQKEVEAKDAERVKVRNQRMMGPAGPVNLPKGPAETALEEEIKELRQKRREVNLKYPMLGRYGSAKDLDGFLGKPEAGRLAALAGDADAVIKNIYTTRENILTSDLDLWLVPPIIDSTIAGLRVGKDTDQRGWVEAKAKAVGAADRNANIALAVLGIGLGLAAAFATGGAALILTSGAVGVGVYDAVQTTEQHFMHNAAVDTDIDKIDGASLLPENMRQHWGWLVLAWAGLGLDALDVVRVAGQVADVGRGVRTVDEAAQALAAGDAKILERLRRAAGDVDITDTISEANRASISRAVGAEIEIDPRVGRNVEVKYDLDPDTNKIVVSGVVVGSAAKVGDIVAHADTVRMLRRHGTVASRLGDLWTRIRTLGKKGAGNPFPAGSAAFESWRELSKLETLMAAKRAQLREALKASADPTLAQRELRTQLAFLENEYDIHRRVVDSLADARGGRGVIAMNDDTRAAIEAGHRLPDVDKAAADLTDAEIKGSSYYFRRENGRIQPTLKADRPAPIPALPKDLSKYADPLNDVISRPDISEELRQALILEVRQASRTGSVADDTIRGLVAKMKVSKAPEARNVEEALAELRHINDVAARADLAPGSPVLSGIKQRGSGQVKKTYDLGDGIAIDIAPMDEVDALYRAGGQIHLDEVKNTAGALADKLRDDPRQLEKLAKWRAGGSDRAVGIVVETDRKWTDLLGGSPDTISRILAEGIPIKIAGRTFSPADLRRFYEKVSARYLQAISSGMQPRAFFELEEMKSLESAADFVGFEFK